MMAASATFSTTSRVISWWLPAVDEPGLNPGVSMMTMLRGMASPGTRIWSFATVLATS